MRVNGIRDCIKSESGQIFVFTLALIFFIALLVCVFLNSAVLSLYKMKLQTTADACALTGAAYQAKLLDIIGDINDIISKLYVIAQVAMAVPLIWNWDFIGYEPYNSVYKPIIKEIVIDSLQPVQDAIANYGGIGVPLLMQYVADKNMKGAWAIPIHNLELNYKLGWKDTDNMNKYRKKNGMYFFYTCTIYVFGIPIPITPLPLWPLLWEDTGEGSQGDQVKKAQDECRNGGLLDEPDYEEYLEDTDKDGDYSDQEKADAVSRCINDKLGLGTEEGMGQQGPSLYRPLFLMKDREFITYSAVAVIGPSIGYEKFFLGKLFNFKKLEFPSISDISLDLGSLKSYIQGITGGWYAVAAAKPYDGKVWDGTNGFWALFGGTLGDILASVFSLDLNKALTESDFSKPYKVWLFRIKDIVEEDKVKETKSWVPSYLIDLKKYLH
ncbi:MAG: TadE/TadG family type IV pilus assembly protein [Candidatus Aminicenantia bacterium]